MRGRRQKKERKNAFFCKKNVDIIPRAIYNQGVTARGQTTNKTTNNKQNNKTKHMKKNALDLAWAYDMIPDPGEGETLWAYRPTPAERAAHRDVWGDGEWIPVYDPVLGDSWENCRPIWRASRQTSPSWWDTVWEPGWHEDGDYLIYDGGEEN